MALKTIKTYHARLMAESVQRAILVVQQDITPSARQLISEMSSKYHLEVFRVLFLVHFLCLQNGL